MGKKGINPIDRHIGARVRQRRVILGMSQTELTQGLGISFQQIQKYEKGSNRISGSRLQQFADKLGVEPAYFFAGAPSSGITKQGHELVDDHAVADFIGSRQGLTFIRAYSKIERANIRNRLVDLAAAIAQLEEKS